MSIGDVRKTLEQENELLDCLIAAAAAHPEREMTGQAKYIKKSWVTFLKRRKSTNTKQMKLSPGALRDDFTSEIDQLDKYIDDTPSRKKYSESWQTFLVCEREISDSLRKKISAPKPSK